MRVTPVSQKAPTELNQLLESNTLGLLEHKLGDVPGLEDWGVLFEGALHKVAWVHPHFYCHLWALWPSFRRQQWPTVWLISTAWWELSLCSSLDKTEEIVPGEICKLILNIKEHELRRKLEEMLPASQHDHKGDGIEARLSAVKAVAVLSGDRYHN